MADYKIILGYIAAGVGVASSAVYIWQVWKNKVKPHAFSWVVWSIVASLGFSAQVVKHAGAGSWATGVTAAANIVICCLAFYKGEKNFKTTDWWFLFAALLACLLWWLTKEPTLAVILASITNGFGMLPTLLKSYRAPQHESISYFGMATVKWVFGLMALQSYVLATWLFPAALLLANFSVVVVVLLRRKN